MMPRVTLESVCEINPRRPSSLERPDDFATSFVPMPAIDALSGTINERLTRPFGEVKRGYTYFENGDVLFAKITPCMQNGKHAICQNLIDGFGFGSTEFHVLRPGPILRPEWLHFFLRQPDLLEDAQRHFTGAVGQQRLPEDFLRTIEIPLPTPSKQQLTVAHLATKMSLIAQSRRAAQERLAAAEALPTAYLRKVFEGHNWPVVELQNLCSTITDGTHLPPPFTDQGIPFLFVRNMVAGNIDFNVTKYISEETFASLTKKHRAEKGDILFSAVGSFGVAVVVDTDARFAFQRHIAHIKPHVSRVAPTFLTAYLNSPFGKAQSEAVALGGAQRTVTLKDLRKFLIPTPSFDIQRQIVDALAERLNIAEALTTRCREELAAIDVLPAALLAEAFGGDSR